MTLSMTISDTPWRPGNRGLVVAVFSCVSCQFKKLESSAARCWKGWLPRPLADKPFSTRHFSEQMVLGVPTPTSRQAGAEDLHTDESSSRFKAWRNVVLESTQETFSGRVDSGPATALSVCRKMLQEGGGPKRWFTEGAKELSIGRKDRA